MEPGSPLNNGHSVSTAMGYGSVKERASTATTAAVVETENQQGQGQGERDNRMICSTTKSANNDKMKNMIINVNNKSNNNLVHRSIDHHATYHEISTSTSTGTATAAIVAGDGRDMGSRGQRTAADDSPSAAALTTAEVYRKYKFSVWIMILVNLLDNINFAIVIPSLYPYVKNLGGSKTFYGWCVSIYSIASFVFAPLCGLWSNHRPHREVMCLTLVLEVVGNVMYSLAPTAWGILIARALVGISATNVTTTRAYLAGATSPEERTRYMSLMMMAQVLGFVFGPAMGAALSKIPVWVISRQEPRIMLDQYTVVGWLSAFLGLVCVVVLFFFMEELPEEVRSTSAAEKMKRKRKRRKRKTRATSSRDYFTEKQPTSAIRIQGNEDNGYDVDDAQDDTSSIQYGHAGEVLSASASTDDVDGPKLLATATAVEETPLLQANNAQSIDGRDNPVVRTISIVSCMLIYFVSVNTFTVFETVGTPLTATYYGWHVWENGLLYVGASFVSVAGFIMVSIMSKAIPDKVLLVVSMVVQAIGFGVLIDWSGVLWIGRFFIGAFIISLILPMTQAIVMALFSKVIEERSQGVYMGWMTSVASLARIVAPLYSTYIFDHVGAYALFGLCAGMSLLVGVYQLAVYPFVQLHPSQVLDHARPTISAAARCQEEEASSDDADEETPESTL